MSADEVIVSSTVTGQQPGRLLVAAACFASSSPPEPSSSTARSSWAVGPKAATGCRGRRRVRPDKRAEGRKPMRRFEFTAQTWDAGVKDGAD